jgi:hypothetical protein
MSRPHLELRAVQEVLTKLRHVAAYCKELTVEASEELITIFRLQPRLHPQLWALVADIQAYKPKLVKAPPTKQLPYLAMLESVGDWEQLEGELGAAEPTPELQEQLSTPANMPRKARFTDGPAVHIFFDGGSKQGLGTAGFVILDTLEREV